MITFVTAVYLLLPFGVLLFQWNGYGSPAGALREVLTQKAGSDGYEFLKQVYLLSYGAFLTLLMINLFIEPIASQLLREEVKVGTKSQLAQLVSDTTHNFFRYLDRLFSDNSRGLRGVSGLDTEYTSHLNAALTNGRLIGLPQSDSENLASIIVQLREQLEELSGLAEFLTKYEPDTNGGRNIFNRSRKRDIGKLVEGAVRDVEKVYSILGVQFSDGLQSIFRADRDELASSWLHLTVAASDHYKLAA